MRRADRLFQIIQILRRSSRPVTASELSAELEVSPRTVYRDMADLIGQRVPIQGEAGLGYILDDAFDMPPLMLTPDEIEAAVLGAQWVAARGDPALANAARDLIAKITSVVPERLRPLIAMPSMAAPAACGSAVDGIDIARTRAWIRAGRKIRIDYRDERGTTSERVIWPIVIGMFDSKRMLAAWCELRQDFRHFRTDRVVAADFLEDAHGHALAALRQRWKRHMADRPRSPPGDRSARV
jgi:predicted DNA-binding transcriptional regulator YafY